MRKYDKDLLKACQLLITIDRLKINVKEDKLVFDGSTRVFSVYMKDIVK